MRRLGETALSGLLLLIPTLVLLAGTADTSGRRLAAGGLFQEWILAASLAPLVCGLVLLAALPRPDVQLVATCGMLTSIGAVSLMGIAQLPGGTRPFFLDIASRHLAFTVAAFAAMTLGAYLSRFAPIVLRFPYLTAASALLLIASTMLVGTEVNGARLWIVVGPFRLQPAELARVLLALFVGVYLYDRRHLIAATWQVGQFHLPPIPYLLPVAGALGIALAALALQNDLGMAAVTALGAFAIIASSLRSRWSVLATGAAVAAVIWAAANLSPRVQARVASWLDPWQAPAGTGYQFIQGDYGLAVGGIGGARVAPDVRNVPEVQTDFILTAIGAQSGLLVAAAVLALLAIVVLRCAWNAMRAPTELESQMALALTVLLALQILLILGGVLRLLPLTGLTIPFVSYGGTSLLVTGFTVGVIIGLGAGNSRRLAR